MFQIKYMDKAKTRMYRLNLLIQIHKNEKNSDRTNIFYISKINII